MRSSAGPSSSASSSFICPSSSDARSAPSRASPAAASAATLPRRARAQPIQQPAQRRLVQIRDVHRVVGRAPRPPGPPSSSPSRRSAVRRRAARSARGRRRSPAPPPPQQRPPRAHAPRRPPPDWPPQLCRRRGGRLRRQIVPEAIGHVGRGRTRAQRRREPRHVAHLGERPETRHARPDVGDQRRSSLTSRPSTARSHTCRQIGASLSSAVIELPPMDRRRRPPAKTRSAACGRHSGS